MSGGTPGASTLFPFGQDQQNFQPHWGVYASTGTLPNTVGNILIVGKFENLRVGQLAYVTGLGTYQCDAVGTAGGGDAIWSVAGVAVTDHFAPKYLVGNVPAGDSAVAYAAGGFTYFADTGDGAGIEAALAAAALVPGDVLVRPGTYDFETGVVACPLTVPAGCILRGAGRAVTLLVTKQSGSQQVFQLAAGTSEVADLKITQISTGATSTYSLISGFDGGAVRRCDFVFSPRIDGSEYENTCIEAGCGYRNTFVIQECSGVGVAVSTGVYLSMVKCGNGQGVIKIIDLTATGFEVPIYLGSGGGGTTYITRPVIRDFASWAIEQSAADAFHSIIIDDPDISTSVFPTPASFGGAIRLGPGGVGGGTYNLQVRGGIIFLNVQAAGSEGVIEVASGNVFISGSWISGDNATGPIVRVASSNGTFGLIAIGNHIWNNSGAPGSIGVEIDNANPGAIVGLNAITATTQVVNTGFRNQILGNTSQP